MTTKTDELRPGEEQAVGALLRQLDPRIEPPAEIRDRVRAAVAAEWRSVVAARKAASLPEASRRSWLRPALAMAATLAAVAIGIQVFAPGIERAPVTVASLSRVSGAVEYGNGADWRPVSAGQTLSAGDSLLTGPRARAAVTLSDGVTLRLDADTKVAFAARDRLVIDRGAVYLDSGLDSTTGRPTGREVPFDIVSAFGTTRHFGTQYEVRLLPEQMLVSVREGRVAVAAGRARTEANAGEQLVVTSTGPAERRAIAATDARWSWTQEVTPPFAIEQRPLAEFLQWVARETGRELSYESADVAAAAQRTVLRGSVAGLPPETALPAVMATTPLRYQVDGERIVVGVAAADRPTTTLTP